MPEWLAGRLRPSFAESFVVLDHAVPPLDVELGVGARAISDVYPDKGPLCGIYTALRHARTEYCFILACDMPFPSMRLIEAMVKKLDGQKALVPREGNRLQPFFALYSQEIKGCLYSILLGENLRVCNVAVKIGAEYMDLSEIRAFDPYALSFFNINYPEDEALFRYIKSVDSGAAAAFL
jgi:molybdopterin-guanine dinucleotide biosynthesis protein A